MNWTFLLNSGCQTGLSGQSQKSTLATAVTISSYFGFTRESVKVNYVAGTGMPDEHRKLVMSVGTTLSQTSVAGVLTSKVTAAFLSRLATLTYTCRHLLGAMAKGQSCAERGSPGRKGGRDHRA